MKLTAESTVINDEKINADIGTAQTTANDAKSIADNTNQYFWFTSSGTDTGAHITETTQAQFLASPSGGNLLARSNGIAVRDGLTELATFGTSIRLGEDTKFNMRLTPSGSGTHGAFESYNASAKVMSLKTTSNGDGSLEFAPSSIGDSYPSGITTESDGDSWRTVWFIGTHPNEVETRLLADAGGNFSQIMCKSNTNGASIEASHQINTTSDRRLKDHIRYLGEDADAFIRELKPAYYQKDSKNEVGFYAQDVEKIDEWECMVDETNGFKTLAYSELIAPLVAYCQHLEKRIEELEKKG